MNLVVKSAGAFVLAGYVACLWHNIFRLHLSLRESFTFAFVQLALMIPTILGAAVAFKGWTAIAILCAVAIWVGLRLRRTHG